MKPTILQARGLAFIFLFGFLAACAEGPVGWQKPGATREQDILPLI